MVEDALVFANRLPRNGAAHTTPKWPFDDSDEIEELLTSAAREFPVTAGSADTTSTRRLAGPALHRLVGFEVPPSDFDSERPPRLVVSAIKSRSRKRGGANGQRVSLAKEITHKQSSRWQDIARIPKEKFEQYIRDRRKGPTGEIIGALPAP